MADVQPSRSRSVLATFKGTNGQTGVHTRTRLQCARSGWTPESPGRRLHPGGPHLRVVWGSFGPHSDYNSLLNDTVFCPQAAGSTGEIGLVCQHTHVSLLNRHIRLDYAPHRFYVRWLHTGFRRPRHTLCLP